MAEYRLLTPAEKDYEHYLKKPKTKFQEALLKLGIGDTVEIYDCNAPHHRNGICKIVDVCWSPSFNCIALKLDNCDLESGIGTWFRTDTGESVSKSLYGYRFGFILGAHTVNGYISNDVLHNRNTPNEAFKNALKNIKSGDKVLIDGADNEEYFNGIYCIELTSEGNKGYIRNTNGGIFDPWVYLSSPELMGEIGKRKEGKYGYIKAVQQSDDIWIGEDGKMYNGRYNSINEMLTGELPQQKENDERLDQIIDAAKIQIEKALIEKSLEVSVPNKLTDYIFKYKELEVL